MEAQSGDSDDSNMDLFVSSPDGVASNADADSDVVAFDIDLPAAHNVNKYNFDIEKAFLQDKYLGEMDRVSGVQYLEPNQHYEIPIIIHNSLVFPGETLPMILSRHLFQGTNFNDDGLVFGVVFRELIDRANARFFGVTCQVYEKSNDDTESITIKSRAYQRFYIRNEEFFDYLHSQASVRDRTRHACVIILPEIELTHPLYGHDSNSLSKFRTNEEMKFKLLKYQSKSASWPDFVYKMYDVSVACAEIKKFLLTLKIDTVPMDLVSMSFWFCQNAILSTEGRHKAFLTNNVLERILIVYQLLQEEKFIVCKNCRTKIAKVESLFPMSKEGVKSNFCNSHGYVHDTHTITDALSGAVSLEGEFTGEFSWYPGYTWQYVHCVTCERHLGWNYFSPNLMPKTFLGLSGNCVYFDTLSNLQMNPPQYSNGRRVEFNDW